MSRDDIILIKPCDFYKKKDIAVNAAISEKYKTLFGQYNCFSENAVVLIQPSVQAPKHPKKYPGVTKREHKSVKRIILGILNVINSDNYKKMLIKTKILINSENLCEIVREILDKCVYQIFYLSIYSNFIRDLMDSFSENERTATKALINSFVSDFIKEGYLLETPKTQDAYHDFCIMQKNKMAILSKNLMVLEFIFNTDFINIISISDYSNLIFKAFMDNINVNNDRADVLLQMMVEMSKKDIKFDTSILEKIKTIHKLQFMINDIIQKSSTL